jgi:hypothetical protein
MATAFSLARQAAGGQTSSEPPALRTVSWYRLAGRIANLVDRNDPVKNQFVSEAPDERGEQEWVH